MYIKQVRTKGNSFNTVKYDSAGNILTPERKKELKALSKKKKNKKIKAPKWIKIVCKYDGSCCVCNTKMLIGTEILWNKKTKRTKHTSCR